jgi:hypothetical protein
MERSTSNGTGGELKTPNARLWLQQTGRAPAAPIGFGPPLDSVPVSTDFRRHDSCWPIQSIPIKDELRVTE